MVQRPMAAQKVAAYVSIAQKSETLWSAVLVFLGALFLLATIPFYPLFLVPLLAAGCGLMALRMPPLGVIAGVVLAFFAIIFPESSIS